MFAANRGPYPDSSKLPRFLSVVMCQMCRSLALATPSLTGNSKF